MWSIVDGTVGLLEMHVGKLALHVLVGEHADVLNAEWFEDVFLEVVIEGHASYAFDHVASPVNVRLC